MTTTDYHAPPATGLRVSAATLAEREYAPVDRFVERDQPVHQFGSTLIITDEAGDAWRVEPVPGGGLRIISWPQRHAGLNVRPECSNVVRLVVDKPAPITERTP